MAGAAMAMASGKRAEALVRQLENRGAASLAAVEKPVRRIVEDVRKNGDRALRAYAEKWDGLQPRQPLRVPPRELERAWKSVSEEFKEALRTAAGGIRRYCEWQMPMEWRRPIQPGIQVGQVVRPLESAGCYVPGGRYPLPSTLLMTVIPAQVAGVKEIRVVSPGRGQGSKQGRAHNGHDHRGPARETLAAAFFLEIEEFYRVGGAQAIAALAYGSESVPPVRKIVGPGNLYVTAAKKLVAFDCAIDFLAGPTETVIVDHGGDPRFIAADLVAQAEHDPEAMAVFITASKPLAQAVAAEIKRAAARLETARASLARHGAILVAASRAQAMEFANRIAPEHITVNEEDLAAVRNAGSIFVGRWSPQAAGDYASGPNHVLPTGAAARSRAGLGVMDFLKTISLQQLSPEGLGRIAPTIVTLAEAEGLTAHAESIRARRPHV